MHYYIGMMSGTSLDGVDAVLIEKLKDSSYRVKHHVEIQLPKKLKETLKKLNYPNHFGLGGELHTATIAAQEITKCYAQTYEKLIMEYDINPDDIIAIGAHGQTIRHEPNSDTPYTIQLLNGALLSHLTKQTVVCDFRSKDIAAGGQGAPLAPIFHQQLFDCEKPFAVVNIGGISNISLIEGDNVSGYDCGPGNCLLDEWVAKHLDKPYDVNGDWATEGNILPELLELILQDEYFSELPPKSTGRDYFHIDWLTKYLSGYRKGITPVDVMRTITRLTAVAIVDELPNSIKTLILCGGGAKNSMLVKDIESLLPNTNLTLTNSWGVDTQHVESLGFALLAKATLENIKTDTRNVTGASLPIVLGAIYPH